MKNLWEFLKYSLVNYPCSPNSFSSIVPIWFSNAKLMGSFGSTCYSPGDGRTMKTICLLQLCRIGVIIYDWFDIPLLKAYYNFGFDHFNMSWKKAGIWGLVDCFMGNTGPFASGDWILPDLTIQGSIRLNTHLCTFPNTYYFSYATKRTRKILGLTVPSGILGIHPLLFVRVLQMSQWRHPPDASLPYKGYRCVSKFSLYVVFNSFSHFHSLVCAIRIYNVN